MKTGIRALCLSLILSVVALGARAADEITLTLPASIAESTSAQGSVTLSSAPGPALTVALATADARLSLPASVTVPAGQTSVNFTFTYSDDAYIDANAASTVTATAAGWATGSAQVMMLDNERHELDFGTGPLTVTEGSNSGYGVLIYPGGLVRSDLTVTIENGNTSEVDAPATSTLTIPAGKDVSLGHYYFYAVDDTEKDGAQVVTITASAPGLANATLEVTVRDNDPASISWPAITGPVTAGAVLPVELRARTIDGDAVALSGPVAITATADGQPATVFPSSLNAITTTGATKFFLTKAGVNAITATAGDITATSAPFTVVASAPFSTFEWSAITTPMMPGVARSMTLSARDAFGNAISSFTGTADISAFAQTRTDAVGTGTGEQSHVLDPAFTRSRSQILIRATSLGGAGRICNLALELLGAPTRPYDELTIRLKHTAQHFAPSSWDDSGWTVVRSGAWLPTGAGWVTIPFQTPFEYDGTSNLYVDVSFINDSPASPVLCQGTYVSGFFDFYAGTNDASYGAPTTWSGASPPANVYFRPNLRLGFGTAIGVSPAVTSALVNGQWTGDVTLTGAAPAHVTLRAAGGSAFGASAEFDLGLFPPSAPVMDDEPIFTQGPANTVSWSAVPSAGSYYVEASTNMYFESDIIGSGWITGTSHTFTLSDGTYSFRVKARRSDDTTVESTWSNNFVYSIQDSIGPVISVNGLAAGSGGTLGTVRGSLTLSGNANDSAGVATVTVGGVAAGDSSWSSVVTTPGSGSATVAIVATDSVGNQSTRTLTITRLADADADGLPDAWQQSTGLYNPPLTAADAGPDGDPDHDGFNNLMELALGKNPLSADPSPITLTRVPASQFPGGGLITGGGGLGNGPVIVITHSPSANIEFDRPIGIIDVSYLLEMSNDLSTWSSTTVAGTITPNPDGVTEHVLMNVSDSITSLGSGFPIYGVTRAHRFFRLRIVPAP